MTEIDATDAGVPTADDGDEGGDIAEPRHTPGPWDTGTDGSPVFVRAKVECPDGRTRRKTIAHISETIYSEPLPADENAQLIATAPELSAALHNLIREAEDAADALEVLGDEGDAGMLRLQIEAAKRSLNKARGGA